MKKLSVIILVALFIFGLAGQVAAEVVYPLAVSDFTEEDELITFDDVPINEPIPAQFSRGEFSPGLYGDDYLSYVMWNSEPGVSNLDSDNFYGQLADYNNGLYELYKPVITVTFFNPVTRVGFDVGTPQGSMITVRVFRGDVETKIEHQLVGSSYSFIGFEDPDGIDAIEISGDGYVGFPPDYDLVGALAIDNFRFGGVVDTGPTDITVQVEIKPPNCLGAQIPIDGEKINGKKVNAKSKGVTRVVIVGNGEYDVTEIDPSKVLLQGVPPVRDAIIADVSTCNNDGGDGEPDLVLKFNTEELVDAMGVSQADREAIENGEWPYKSLELTGNLFEESGGTAIKGEASVTLVGRLKPAKANNGKVSFQGHDRGHHHGWYKSHGQHKHKGWDNNRGHHNGLKNHQ
jgi:hypothetical protein